VRSMIPLFVCLSIGCSGDGESKDTTTSDTDTDTTVETETETETETATDPDRVAVDFALVDLLTGNPVEDMELTVDGDSATTNGDGEATVTVALDADFEITGSQENYYDHVWVGYGGQDHSYSTNMLSRAGGTLLASQLGLTIDPSKGVVVVTVADANGSPIADTAVTLDASSDLSLVPNDAEALGFSAGNVTLANNNAWVIFVNVDAGDLAVTVDTPDGLPCYFAGGGPAADWAVSRADSVTNMALTCE